MVYYRYSNSVANDGEDDKINTISTADCTIVKIYNRQQCIIADTQVVRMSLVEAAVRTLAAGAELLWKYKFTQRTIT